MSHIERNFSLEEKFSRELGQKERDDAAKNIIKSRQELPTDWRKWDKDKKDKRNVEATEETEIKETHEQLRRDFMGRLFKTKKFLAKEMIFKNLIKGEQKKEYEKIRENLDKRLAEIIAETPLSEEEQEKYLSEEAVINMSLEDYLALLKRLSGYYLSHVTRYGVREQVFYSSGGGHSRGEGKFMDNFTELLEAGKLGSVFSNIINRTEYAKNSIKIAINERLEKNKSLSREELIQKITNEIMQGEEAFMATADASSSHMAANHIAGNLYGSEIDYDIYLYYPAEVIAHNYHHAGTLNNDSQSYVTDTYNDVSVWNKGLGIPIDAGITCIPKHLAVHQETGSQYALDDEHHPIVNHEVAKHIKLYESNPEKFRDTLWKLDEKRSNLGKSFYNSDDFREVASELGFKNLKKFRSFYEVRPRIGDCLETFYKFIDRSYYERPDSNELVSSQNFWEEYFKKNPKQKPSKLLYYEWEFPPYQEKNREKNEAFKKLRKQKEFMNTDELPNYAQYLEEIKKEIKPVVGEVYDEMMSQEEGNF